MNPKVSILIPTYNREKYLPQTIESSLAQDYPNLEVIVADDASSDKTPEVIKKYLGDKRFRYIRNEKNAGLVKNFHDMIFDYAKGDWFLLVSDDDYFVDETYISKAIKLTQKDPGIVMVYANSIILDETNKRKTTYLDLPFDEITDGKKIFLKYNKVMPQNFALCNIMFNSKIARKLEIFYNPKNIFSDGELYLKMCLMGKTGIIKDYVSVYRFHPSNASKTLLSEYQMAIEFIDFALQPYLIAKRNNMFPKAELEKWKKRVIIYVMQNCMLIFARSNKNMDQYIKHFKAKDEELYYETINSLYFKLKKIIYGNFYFFLPALKKIKSIAAG